MKTSAIKFDSSFETILGKTAEEYPTTVRIERWNEWQQAAIKAKKKHLIETWLDTSGCRNCIHLDKGNAWCNFQGLPCTVNPILSFRMGMVGMACMGLGYEESQQLELFEA